MADADTAAVEVGALARNAQLRFGVQVHHGKGFIDFPVVDVCHAQAGALQQLGDRRHRACAHDLRCNAHHGPIDQPCFGPQACPCRCLGAGHHQSGGAIGHAAGVARCHLAFAVLAKRGLQARELLARDGGPRKLVLCK